MVIPPIACLPAPNPAAGEEAGAPGEATASAQGTGLSGRAAASRLRVYRAAIASQGGGRRPARGGVQSGDWWAFSPDGRQPWVGTRAAEGMKAQWQPQSLESEYRDAG